MQSTGWKGKMLAGIQRCRIKDVCGPSPTVFKLATNNDQIYAVYYITMSNKPKSSNLKNC